MALRTGHGTGAGVPRIEVLPPDELPDGIPETAGAVHRAAAEERGRFVPGNARSALGGRASRGKTRLARRLGLTELADDAAFAPYRRAAVDFRRSHCGTIARAVGGGMCGPGPSSIVASAAWQLAASRFLFDKGAAGGDADLLIQASSLANASRQNLLAAHELAAKEAKSRRGSAEAPKPWAFTEEELEESEAKVDAERAAEAAADATAGKAETS